MATDHNDASKNPGLGIDLKSLTDFSDEDPLASLAKPDEKPGNAARAAGDSVLGSILDMVAEDGEAELRAIQAKKAAEEEAARKAKEEAEAREKAEIEARLQAEQLRQQVLEEERQAQKRAAERAAAIARGEIVEEEPKGPLPPLHLPQKLPPRGASFYAMTVILPSLGIMLVAAVAAMMFTPAPVVPYTPPAKLFVAAPPQPKDAECYEVEDDEEPEDAGVPDAATSDAPKKRTGGSSTKKPPKKGILDLGGGGKGGIKF